MVLISSEYVCLCFANDSGWNKQNNSSVLCAVNNQGDPETRRGSKRSNTLLLLDFEFIESFSVTSILYFAISNWILVKLLQLCPRYWSSLPYLIFVEKSLQLLWFLWQETPSMFIPGFCCCFMYYRIFFQVLFFLLP